MANTPYLGIPIPGTGDAPANAASFAAALSAMEKYGVMPFADAAARDAIITPSSARKAGMLAYLRNLGVYTVVQADGGSWTPLVTAAWQRSGAAITGISNPAASLANVDGLVVKTGQNTSFTTTAFGNEYMPAVTYSTPFPTAALVVVITQLYVNGDTIPYAGAVALDIQDATQHRVGYIGGSSSTKRAYEYIALGY